MLMMLALRVAESVQSGSICSPAAGSKARKWENEFKKYSQLILMMLALRVAESGPKIGSNCSPIVGSKARKWQSEFKSISS